MNRFTRNNLLLITVIAISGVVAMGLLIYCIIRYMDMTASMDEIRNIQAQVKALGKKNPSPVEANKVPIETNTKFFEKAAKDLEKTFRSPMTDLAEKFVAMLEETNPPKEDDKVVPLTVERYRSAYDEMWRSGQTFVDKDYNYKNFREQRFKNWNQVVRKLLPEAQKLTTEPLNENTLPEVLMSYIGIPRVMGEQPDKMVKFMKDYQAVLLKKLEAVKFSTEGNRIDWFGFDPDPTPHIIASRFNNPAEQYHQVARVWDLCGDIIERMVSCSKKLTYTDKDGKVVTVNYSADEVARLRAQRIPFTESGDHIETYYGIALRASLTPMKGTEAGANPEEGGLRNAVAGNDEGAFKVYRMRVAVGSNMAGIRTFIRALENAYKDGRIYVIRSVALYAEHDGALEVMQSRGEAAGIKTAASKPVVQTRSGRRGRGRGPVVEETDQSQRKLDPAIVERARRKQEARFKNYKFFELPGYGEVLIGNNKSCKAVVDFDYYELKYEAK